MYKSVQAREEDLFALHDLRRLTASIYDVCKLDFFSTELVLTSEQKIVAVDYVNEICDLRLQSSHVDGVPNDIILQIIHLLIHFIKS